MNDTPLTAEVVQRKCDDITTGSRVRCRWGRLDDLASIVDWHGTVIEKKELRSHKFLVVKFDEGGPQQYQLPHQSGGVSYYVIELEDAVEYADWLKAIPQTVSLLGIVPWKPASWKPMIEATDKVMARSAIMTELKAFFRMEARTSLGPGKVHPIDWEKAVYYETVLAWVSFAQTIREWAAPSHLAVLEPTILRLCALRRGSIERLSAEEVQREMEAVYEAHRNTDKRSDKLSELMCKALIKK